ncbi:MAG: arylesterase, partial [Pseudolabrys sp.]
MTPHFSQPRSYGRNLVAVQRLVASVALALCIFGQVVAVKATERPVNIVVLGDSLSAGYGLTL